MLNQENIEIFEINKVLNDLEHKETYIGLGKY